MRRIEITFCSALERWIGGLDKTYGCTSVSASAGWPSRSRIGCGPRGQNGLGWLWLERPERGLRLVLGFRNAQRPINLTNSHE